MKLTSSDLHAMTLTKLLSDNGRTEVKGLMVVVGTFAGLYGLALLAIIVVMNMSTRTNISQ
jgi:hypothetical protein